MSHQPRWTVFLTPLAIIVGALIVAAAIFVTDDDADSSTALPADGGVSALPTEPADDGEAPATLLTALRSYAGQVDIDVDSFDQCLADADRATTINDHLALGSELDVTGTPTFFVNNKKLVGAQPAEVLLEIIERERDGAPASLDEYSETIQALASTNPPRFEILEEPVDVSGAEIDGDPNAPVMVAEFSDFQCPFCRRWVDQSMDSVRDVLGEDVAFAFMHFPLTQLHPNAGFASFAAICAGEQGKFWEMHDLLFAQQDEWAQLPPN